MVGVIKQLEASHSLPGGALNQEHLFQPIYQMLLAIHTAAFCCLSLTVQVLPAMSCLRQSAEEMSELALHPVLAAMLTNTIAVWTTAEAGNVQQVGLACFHTLL